MYIQYNISLVCTQNLKMILNFTEPCCNHQPLLLCFFYDYHPSVLDFWFCRSAYKLKTPVLNRSVSKIVSIDEGALLEQSINLLTPHCLK